MGYKPRRKNRAGKGGGGGGALAGADDEATQPTPLPTSTTSGDPAPLSTSRLPLHPLADQDAMSSSAGTSSGDGGSGGGAAPSPQVLLLSPPPVSPSRDPSAFPSSPPPGSPPRAADRDTEPLWELIRGHSNNIIQEKIKVLSKQYGIFRRRTGREGNCPGRAFLVSYLGLLGHMQHRQAVIPLHSKVEQTEIDAVCANVLIMSISSGYLQFISVMEQSLRPVDLDQLTDEFSLRHLIGRPLVQTVPDTCAIVSTAKCVESQHRKLYEARHGVGTFSCTAAAPRKLRKACRRNMIWSPKTGAYVVDVLKMIKKLGGVRTTNAPTPAPSFLKVHSWEVHRWDSGR